MKFLISEFQQLKCLVYVQNKLSSLGRRREGKAKAKQSKLPCPLHPLLRALPLAQPRCLECCININYINIAAVDDNLGNQLSAVKTLEE